jgi:hypothetical protein
MLSTLKNAATGVARAINPFKTEGMSLVDLLTQANMITTPYDQNILGEALRNATNLHQLLDECIFIMRAAPDQPNPWIKYYNTGQRDTGSTMGYTDAPGRAAKYRLRRNANGTLKLNPESDLNNAIGSDTCCGVGPSRWQGYGTRGTPDRTMLRALFQLNSDPESAGDLSLGHHSNDSRWMDDAVHTNWGAIRSTSHRGKFRIYIYKAGPALTAAYYQLFIAANPDAQRRCCIGDYDDDLTQEVCGVVGYLPQMNKCDVSMTKFCNDNPNDSLCSCINSPLKDTDIPVGCDINCQRGTGVYMRNSEYISTMAGCKYIDCTQNINMTPEQRATISDVHIEQNCDITSIETEVDSSGTDAPDINTTTTVADTTPQPPPTKIQPQPIVPQPTIPYKNPESNTAMDIDTMGSTPIIILVFLGILILVIYLAMRRPSPQQMQQQPQMPQMPQMQKNMQPQQPRQMQRSVPFKTS